MTRPSAAASQRTSSWRGTSSRRTVGPGRETEPTAGVGAAQLGRDWLVSFVGFDRRGSGGSLVGLRGGLSYYSMPTPQEPDAPGTPEAPRVPEAPDAARRIEEECDVCGSTNVWWRNCKLLCRGCGAIVKSCADL